MGDVLPVEVLTLLAEVAKPCIVSKVAALLFVVQHSFGPDDARWSLPLLVGDGVVTVSTESLL